MSVLRDDNQGGKVYEVEKPGNRRCIEMTNKKRFKRNIRIVEFEPHSYCNRKCWFCPNSFIDRTGPVKFLDRKIYVQILKDLASIDYSEAFFFAGWCEPFSQPNFLDRVKEASDFVPHAFLVSNSNTDYLTTEIVRQVADNGLSLIRAQLYFDKNEDCTGEVIAGKFARLRDKLPGIKFVKRAGQWFALVDGKMVIHVQSKNFKEVGTNRCDIEVRKIGKRYHTCYEGIQYFGVNFNGQAVPCCHIRSDYPAHEKYLLGQVTDKPGRIFELYRGVILPEQEYPCNACSHNQSHANVKMVYAEILRELKNGKHERIGVNHNHQVTRCPTK